MFENMYENTIVNSDLKEHVNSLDTRLSNMKHPLDQSRIQDNLTASQSNIKSNQFYGSGGHGQNNYSIQNTNNQHSMNSLGHSVEHQP